MTMGRHDIDATGRTLVAVCTCSIALCAGFFALTAFGEGPETPDVAAMQATGRHIMEADDVMLPEGFLEEQAAKKAAEEEAAAKAEAERIAAEEAARAEAEAAEAAAAAYADDAWYGEEGDYGYSHEGDAFAWDPSYGASDFRGLGRVSDGNGVYTWYSENALSGDGLDALNSNGRHVNEDGYVVDGDGYIAVAQPGTTDPDIGAVVDTPFGPGKVYDCNPYGDSWDVYTSW